MNDHKVSDISYLSFRPFDVHIYMEVNTLKVRKYFYGTIFIEYSLVLYVVGPFIALFRVVGVPVFTDFRLKCLATVVFPLDIYLN